MTRIDVNDIIEVLTKQVIDHKTQLGRLKDAFSLGNILPLLNGRQDGGIGAGTPDTPLFQHLNQGGFSKMGWGLGKVLLREKFYTFKLIALLQVR